VGGRFKKGDSGPRAAPSSDIGAALSNPLAGIPGGSAYIVRARTGIADLVTTIADLVTTIADLVTTITDLVTTIADLVTTIAQPRPSLRSLAPGRPSHGARAALCWRR
jgi:hypothetical protein